MKKQKPDYVLLVIIAVLVFFGLLMVSSASIGLSQENFNESYYYFRGQVFKGLLPGIVLGAIAYFLPYRFWQKMSFPFLLFSLLLMIAVLIPGLGASHGGAQRWLDLGPISVQPSEFLKLSFIVYLAAWFTTKGEAIKSFSQGLMPFICVAGATAGLILLQPDIGTIGVLCLSSLALFFLAGGRFSHVGLIIFGGLASLWLLTKFLPHAGRRLQVFLNPQLEPQGAGWQINQALLALGSGGFFGVGLGQGLQKFKYLPEPASDSIIAVIGEELGFIGVAGVIILFVLLAARGLRVARHAPDEFSKLLAGGIIALIVIQAIINIMAICGLIPLTGVTLPFFSLGGSSLVVTLVASGILLNISKHSHNS